MNHQSEFASHLLTLLGKLHKQDGPMSKFRVGGTALWAPQYVVPVSARMLVSVLLRSERGGARLEGGSKALTLTDTLEDMATNPTDWRLLPRSHVCSEQKDHVCFLQVETGFQVRVFLEILANRSDPATSQQRLDTDLHQSPAFETPSPTESAANVASSTAHQAGDSELTRVKGSELFQASDLINTFTANKKKWHVAQPELEGKDMLSLFPGKWLTGDILNAYLDLIEAYIQSRERETCGRPIKIYKTYFFTLLEQQQREAKTEDLEARSKKNRGVRSSLASTSVLGELQIPLLVIVPIHWAGNHWSFAVADFGKQQLQFFDSLAKHRGSDSELVSRIFPIWKEFIFEEVERIEAIALNWQQWTEIVVADFPLQDNSDDCGVFMAQGIKQLCRSSLEMQKNVDWSFCQANIRDLRAQMYDEISSQQLQLT